MAKISRRGMVLLLLGCGEDGGVSEGVRGITRLTKLLFLLEREGHVSPSDSDEGFDFKPYDAGPYSSRLYDDLELLENLGYLESRPAGESTDAEAADIDVLDFDHLMGNEAASGDDPPAAPEAYEERQFLLTEKGRKKVEDLLATGRYQPVVDGIRKIKSRFGKHSLNDLLYYVYTRHDDMATESKIRDQVLKRRR